MFPALVKFFISESIKLCITVFSQMPYEADNFD